LISAESSVIDLPDSPVSEAVPAPVPQSPAVPVASTDIFVVQPTSSRRLVEFLTMFVLTILFFRAIAVEPFGVPTGSMAPTLIGNHHAVPCPRCGYRVLIGEPNHAPGGNRIAICSNCGKEDLHPLEYPEIIGDRLLVDKNLWSLRGPRRWEVAVFRCPSDFSKPYVKRVGGLPGESILVQNGDIYIDGQLARKTLAEVRQTSIPVMSMDYVPDGVGWSPRWQITAPPATEIGIAPVVIDGSEIHLRGADYPGQALRLACVNASLDTGKIEAFRDTYAYNGLNHGGAGESVHDFQIACEIEVLGGHGELAFRLNDGTKEEVVTHLAVDTDDLVQSFLQVDKLLGIRTSRQVLRPGRRYRFEMSYTDRRVTAALDGRELFAPVDREIPGLREEVKMPLTITSLGVSAAIRHVVLSRDIHYRMSGPNATHLPMKLGEDEYFMLGDNSSNSDDSRSWRIPAVPGKYFLGKPFLIHQPSKLGSVEIGERIRVFQMIDWDRIRLIR